MDIFGLLNIPGYLSISFVLLFLMWLILGLLGYALIPADQIP